MSSSNSEIRSGRSIPTTRENDLLKIASRMGMVRKGLSDPRLDLRAPSAARPPGARSAHPTREQMSAWRLMSRAHSNNTESQVSLLGVQYSVLLQFAANIQNDVSTQEVVHNHIMKQTSDQKNRYLDIISDTAIEVPEFYVIHPWSMNFKGLVDVLGSYFSSCKLHPEEAYIWIDIFCVNHHNMPLCPTDFSTVGEVIGKCTKTLFVLDEEGKALSQEWIQYQLFQVHHASFPTSSSSGGRRDDRLVVLPTSWDWRAMHFAYDLMEISAEHPQILPSDSEVMSLDEGASQALQMSMAAYGSSADRHHDSVRKLKETMLLGAKRELQRSEKLASVNPQRYFECATAVALLQYLNAELADAEETLHSISVLMDKVNSHLVRSENESKRLYHLSLVFHQKGQLIETMYTLKVLLGSSTSSSTSTWSEVHLQGMSLMVECLCLSKEYTKAELLCRKLIEKRNDWHHQKYDAGAVEDKLLMGNISSAQHLHEEATERCMDALSMAVQISGEDSLLAAKCNQSIAGISLCTSHFKLDPTLYVSKALTTYDRHLGGTHPLLLSCKVLMSKLLIRKNQLAEAESLLSAVLESQLRWYGIEHHDTLEALGLHVDVLRSMGKEEEAATAEKRIIHAGKALLSGRRLDRFKSLSYVSEFLTSREHLLEKAGLHLVRAYSVYKEKLGSDADLTVSTRTQLDDVIQRVRSTGLETLENAQLYGRQDLFKTAETLLNRCWSISKLLHTDANYKGIAESLADALLGQGKAQEAKAVLKAAGLVKKGMTDNMPASYLRWLNKRVAHFMDISAAAASAED
ncbi:hypothetical protein CEUSTIGMA_g11524.t1 [Chlamydomonas eustigma]|uniref:Heterokaryon incompatibility domain-containing protein n=1 Tax=Chlamydomonas eustigma TaxID=1157962 RepID=A0A250XLX9_9CHLO|nr:hypothetical protein CEUSTIGMA_g11524.t1 [Chlamydomonas eustigma]|eukprot:GAX84101.1 hypothetical protein CEUSTIGMA_g11524.t1 [Chlamydomonas eustigma]